MNIDSYQKNPGFQVLLYVLGEYVYGKDHQVALHVIPAATIIYPIQESSHIAPILSTN